MKKLKLLIEELNDNDDYRIIDQLCAIICKYLERRGRI